MAHHATPTFELCAETLEGCEAARTGGADRIELCVSLDRDGLTPPDALVAAAVQRSGLPVHVLLRPEADDFIYRELIVQQIRADIVRLKRMGIAGVVVGVLQPDRTVASSVLRELVQLARPLPVEFHRAFDRTPDLLQALEDVIATGCTRILTSGGADNVIDGAEALTSLVRHARGRVEIAAGGGLRVDNAAELAARWPGQHVHGSLGGAGDGTAALSDRIRSVVAAVRRQGNPPRP